MNRIRVRPDREFNARTEFDEIKVERILGRDWNGYISIAERRAVVRHLTGRINPRTGYRYSAAYIAEVLDMSTRSVVRMRTALGIKADFWHIRPDHGAYLRRLYTRFSVRCANYAPRPGDTGPDVERDKRRVERDKRHADAVCSRSDVRIAMALAAGHDPADLDRCGYRSTQFIVEPLHGRVPLRELRRSA